MYIDDWVNAQQEHEKHPNTFMVPSKEELDRINLPENEINNIKFFNGKPTTSNHNTGYKGRTAIHEILEVNSNMRQLIYNNSSQLEIKKQALKNGMTSLRDAGIEKIKKGSTTIEEVLRATVEDN